MTKPNQPDIIKALAKKYQVAERTVRSWRETGAPIEDPAKLTEWLSNRRLKAKGVESALGITNKRGCNEKAFNVAVMIARGRMQVRRKTRMVEMLLEEHLTAKQRAAGMFDAVKFGLWMADQELQRALIDVSAAAHGWPRATIIADRRRKEAEELEEDEE